MLLPAITSRYREKTHACISACHLLGKRKNCLWGFLLGHSYIPIPWINKYMLNKSLVQILNITHDLVFDHTCPKMDGSQRMMLQSPDGQGGDHADGLTRSVICLHKAAYSFHYRNFYLDKNK